MDNLQQWWREAPIAIQVMVTIGMVVTAPIWIVPALLALFIYGTWETINIILS